MYNMAAMHREDNMTEFQLKPTNQQTNSEADNRVTNGGVIIYSVTRQRSRRILQPRGALTV